MHMLAIIIAIIIVIIVITTTTRTRTTMAILAGRQTKLTTAQKHKITASLRFI